MSTIADPATDEVRPSDLLIREEHDLTILESTDEAGDGVFNADGTVNMVIVRPCNGRGPGSRIYDPQILEAEVPKFRGLSMFDNHDSPAARKARQGIPRPVSELAGVIREATWDPAFTTPDDAEFDFGPGAIIGRCKLTAAMEALVRDVPEAIKGSMNMQATGLRRGSRGGKAGWIVEGFEDDRENQSFDLVTKAGAGGRVCSVLEALYDPACATDRITTADGEEIDMAGMTLQEALQSDEVKGHITTVVQEALAAAGIGETNAIQEAVTEAVEAQRDSIRDEVRDELAQTHRWRSLHSEALRIIESAKLPPAAKARLVEDYGLTELDDDTVTPGRSLALIEAELDSDGVTVKKAAKLVLKDAIDEDVKGLRNIVRESAPTVPYSPGGGSQEGAPAAKFGAAGSTWAERLKSRGLDPTHYGATPAPAATT